MITLEKLLEEFPDAQARSIFSEILRLKKRFERIPPGFQIFAGNTESGRILMVDASSGEIREREQKALPDLRNAQIPDEQTAAGFINAINTEQMKNDAADIRVLSVKCFQNREEAIGGELMSLSLHIMDVTEKILKAQKESRKAAN